MSSFLDTYTWARVKEKKRAQQTLWVTRVCLVPDQVKVKLAWELNINYYKLFNYLGP